MKTIAMKLVVSLGLITSAFGQQIDLTRQVKNKLPPANGGDGTAPGTTLPATCSVGQKFFKTNATAGQNLYGCTATNTWTLESGAATMIPKADATAAYLFLDADRSKRLVRSFATAMSDTLPQANGSTFVSGWEVNVLNNGPGALTITPTTSTFQGSATAIILYSGQYAQIVSDGTNYTAAGSFVLCATCAGTIEMAAGTAPTIVANTAIRYAPTSVTGYTLRELAAACTGILLLTNTANDMVPTCLASTGTGNAVRANNAVMDSLTVTTSCTGCGSTANAVTGASSLTNASSVPFVASSGVLTQDTGFSFNATGTVTPSAGVKILNIASTNNGVGLNVTSTNLLRGGYGAANADGLQMVDQSGSPIWLQTYGTMTSAFSGITKSKAFHGSGTAPSVGTCGTIGAGSTNNAGFITTVTGACAPVVTFSVTATTGWSCPPASNSTTPANSFVQTASSTTTATFTGTSGSNDVIRYVCVPY